jgi:hypothetical protein
MNNPPRNSTPAGPRKIGARFPSYGGMSRRLRYIPDGGALVEVTCRGDPSRTLRRSLDGHHMTACCLDELVGVE